MEFKKTQKQLEALKLMSSNAQNICLYGGSRAGKTLIILFAIIHRALKVKSRHAILRLNFNAVKRSIFLDSFPRILSLAFPDIKLTPQKTDFYYKFLNDSEIWFAGLDDKERVEKILGTEYSTIFFNEVSQIPYSSIQIAKTRLAEKNDLKKKVYYDMNPPSKSDWQYWLFEKKLNPIDDTPLPDPENYASMLLVPQDNIENIDPDYLKILEAMPEKDRLRFLEGKYTDTNDGLVYYSFNRETHVKPQEIKDGTIFVFMDFNVDPMTATIAQFYDEKIHCLDEVYLRNSDTYKMAEELKQRGLIGAHIIPDSTGGNRKTSGKSDFQILRDSGFQIIPTYNPFVTDRVNNINRCFTNDLIEIDPKCKKLINDLSKVSWKNNKLDQAGDNKLLTHCSDNLGYGAWKLLPIIQVKENRSYDV